MWEQIEAQNVRIGDIVQIDGITGFVQATRVLEWSTVVCTNNGVHIVGHDAALIKRMRDDAF